MNPIAVTGIVFACIFGGAMMAMIVGRALPEQHLRPDSKDTVKQGLAMIATLTALVLGLLVAAAKGSYDAQSAAIKQLSADVLLLDRVLARYGAETKEERDLLRRAVALLLNRLWPERDGQTANLSPGEARVEAEAFYEKLAGLSPKNDSQSKIKARALDIANELEKTRLRLFAQKDSAIPLVFLVVLAFWLTILFAGLALLAPRNATVFSVLIVCALSVSGAIFLILELDRPFEGVMRVSSAPLQGALSQLQE
ncbi:MAG TPA: hypothetical protein VH682_10230 [Gemmataceae bacterium]|jgi:hypothetical protein